MACSILVARPGVETVPPVMEAQSLNHWISRDFRKNLSEFWSWVHTNPLCDLGQAI